MIPLESGEVLHARQMNLYYHSLIAVVLAILEALHIRPSALFSMLWGCELWGRFNEISAKIYPHQNFCYGMVIRIFIWRSFDRCLVPSIPKIVAIFHFKLPNVRGRRHAVP